MKRGVVFLILFSSLIFSCSQEDKEPEFNLLGYWNLVNMSFGWTQENSEINFTEKYIFNDDGSFIKFSTKRRGMGPELSVPIQALGTYELHLTDDKTMLHEVRLVFDTEKGMAANCGGEEEYLMWSKEGVLINYSWAACDGPSFVYSKK